MENNRSKEKAAKYAKVYNRILEMIQEGLYPEGSKLMAEPQLAEQLHVSRSTLRQSLALLQEDGILEAKRGVGNFIRRTVDLGATGLEQMNIPVYSSCAEEITMQKIEVLTGISTQYTERIFKRKIPVVIAIHRYYGVGNGIYAYCFTHLASDLACLHTVDLHAQKEVSEFIEKEVYLLAHAKRCDIEVVKETDNLKDKKIVNESRMFLMIKEVLYDTSGSVMLVNKFYIPIEKASAKIFCNH